jgi:two-component system sensor histidine kinase RpfC
MLASHVGRQVPSASALAMPDVPDTSMPFDMQADSHAKHPQAPAGEPTHAALRSAVLAQAALRIRLGIPVWALMLLCILVWGPASAAIRPWLVAVVFIGSIACNVAMLHLARRAPWPAGTLVRIGAIIDPLMLSAGLALTGEPGQVFIGFYLFTILGYGFRIGPEAMRLCQLTALAGFSAVALFSPAWHAHPVTPLSVLVLLAVVPLYARLLIGRLRAAQALAESESHAKSQLLANVSHELRTPLTGIMSSAQLLREAHADADVQRRCDAILALSRDLMLQIDELLDSARQQAGALRLSPAPFSVSELAEDLRCALGPTALAKGIALTVDVAADLPPRLIGDAHYLKRALLNIGGNAVKFTEAGEVRMRMALAEPASDAALCSVHFSCRDTGIGIAPELQARIFDPFFQASSGITRKYGGTGLGMSIARNIVGLMGGVLCVVSAPGKGSLFEFTLPMPVASDASRASDGDDVAHETQAPSPKRVLVADDNATNLLLLKETLEHDGHQVATVRDGREALAALAASDFDVVLLDLNMAVIDGATTLRLYRFGRVDPAPVYILTADATASERLAGCGAAGILHKPIDAAALRHAVASAPLPAGRRSDASTPCGYIDTAVLRDIRAVSDDPGFLETLLSTAVADIERLATALRRGLQSVDGTVVRECAHALSGVCTSIGAAALAELSARLMAMTAADLRQDAARLGDELDTLARHTLRALRESRMSAS